MSALLRSGKLIRLVSGVVRSNNLPQQHDVAANGGTSSAPTTSLYGLNNSLGLNSGPKCLEDLHLIHHYMRQSANITNSKDLNNGEGKENVGGDGGIHTWPSSPYQMLQIQKAHLNEDEQGEEQEIIKLDTDHQVEMSDQKASAHREDRDVKDAKTSNLTLETDCYTKWSTDSTVSGCKSVEEIEDVIDQLEVSWRSQKLGDLERESLVKMSLCALEWCGDVVNFDGRREVSRHTSNEEISGSLSKEIEYVNHVWTRLEQEIQMPINSQHYETLLSLYAKFSHKFCPHYIESRLLKSGIEISPSLTKTLVDSYLNEENKISHGGGVNSTLKSRLSAAKRLVLDMPSSNNVEENLQWELIIRLYNAFLCHGDIDAASHLCLEYALIDDSERRMNLVKDFCSSHLLLKSKTAQSFEELQHFLSSLLSHKNSTLNMRDVIPILSEVISTCKSNSQDIEQITNIIFHLSNILHEKRHENNSTADNISHSLISSTISNLILNEKRCDEAFHLLNVVSNSSLKNHVKIEDMSKHFISNLLVSNICDTPKLMCFLDEIVNIMVNMEVREGENNKMKIKQFQTDLWKHTIKTAVEDMRNLDLSLELIQVYLSKCSSTNEVGMENFFEETVLDFSVVNKLFELSRVSSVENTLNLIKCLGRGIDHGIISDTIIDQCLIPALVNISSSISLNNTKNQQQIDSLQTNLIKTSLDSNIKFFSHLMEHLLVKKCCVETVNSSPSHQFYSMEDLQTLAKLNPSLVDMTRHAFLLPVVVENVIVNNPPPSASSYVLLAPQYARLDDLCYSYRQHGQHWMLENMLVDTLNYLTLEDRKFIYLNTLQTYADLNMWNEACHLTSRAEMEGLLQSPRSMMQQPPTSSHTTLLSNPTEFNIEFAHILATFQRHVSQSGNIIQTAENVQPQSTVFHHSNPSFYDSNCMPPRPSTTTTTSTYSSRQTCSRSNSSGGGSVLDYRNNVAIERSNTIEDLVKEGERVSLQKGAELTIDMLEGGMYPIPKVFRFLLNKLAAGGEVDLMNEIGSHISPMMKREVSFDNRLCNAYLAAGLGEKFLDMMIHDLDTVMNHSNTSPSSLESVKNKFPRGGAMGLLETYPHLIHKFSDLAFKFLDLDYVAPINVLWTFHFINGNEREADKLWESHVKHCSQIMFQKICQTARLRNDTDMACKLVDLLQGASSVTSGAQGIAYSCLLDVFSGKGNYEEALAHLKSGVEEGRVSLNRINRTALLRLKTGLEESNSTEQFPFEIPTKSNETMNDVNPTSSSSDHTITNPSLDIKNQRSRRIVVKPPSFKNRNQESHRKSYSSFSNSSSMCNSGSNSSRSLSPIME